MHGRTVYLYTDMKTRGWIKYTNLLWILWSQHVLYHVTTFARFLKTNLFQTCVIKQIHIYIVSLSLYIYMWPLITLTNWCCSSMFFSPARFTNESSMSPSWADRSCQCLYGRRVRKHAQTSKWVKHLPKLKKVWTTTSKKNLESI